MGALWNEGLAGVLRLSARGIPRCNGLSIDQKITRPQQERAGGDGTGTAAIEERVRAVFNVLS